MTSNGSFDLLRAVGVEVASLNDRQRDATLWSGNVTCMAGPGSGKTRSLAARIAYTLVEHSNQRERVAAITYTRAAAREINSRLQALGFVDEQRVRVGTLHSFCFQDVLLRHSALLGFKLAEESPVLTAEEQAERELDLEMRYGIYNGWGDANNAANTTARRALAVDEGWQQLDPTRLDVVRAYEAGLLADGRLDNEQMVISAYRALRDNPSLVRLMAAAYPYMLVDEYQDLGPVLHRIVLLLLGAGVRVFAVGDPDQSVMGFTGADPKYLLELAERGDFKRFDFEINYRSGTAIVEAAQRILQEVRPHIADPERTTTGVVRSVVVTGGQEEHAAETVAALQRLHGGGLSYAEMAVLYSQKGPLADSVARAIGAAGIPLKQERALKTTRGPLGEFAQSCASRLLAGYRPGAAPNKLDAPSIPELLAQLRRLSQASLDLSDERRLTRGLVEVMSLDPATLDAASFLERLVSGLGLASLIPEHRALRDAADDLKDASLEDLAGHSGGEAVTFTTYASSKGREFRAVVLPGCIEGLVPKWSNGANFTLLEPTRRELARSRAAFYVAFTRAEDEVVMISGPFWLNKGGYRNGKGHSRFVYDALSQAHPYADP